MKNFVQISEILVRLCGADAVALESRLQDDLMLDSLQMVMLLMELENTFEITLDESDMNPFNLATVKDVVNLVGKYCGDSDEENS